MHSCFVPVKIVMNFKKGTALKLDILMPQSPNDDLMCGCHHTQLKGFLGRVANVIVFLTVSTVDGLAPVSLCHGIP